MRPKECQSKEDVVCDLPIGSCDQCKPDELYVYKTNLNGIYDIIDRFPVNEPYRTMIHQLCKNAFNGIELNAEK